MPIAERALRGGVKTSVDTSGVVIDGKAAETLLAIRSDAEKECAVYDERISSLESQQAELSKKAMEKWGVKDPAAILNLLNQAKQNLAQAVKAADGVMDVVVANLATVPIESRPKFAGSQRIVNAWQAWRGTV